MLPADRIQIQQVVTNLILNAIEVMELVEAEMCKLIIELSTAPSTLRLRSVQAMLPSISSGQAGQVGFWSHIVKSGRKEPFYLY